MEHRFYRTEHQFFCQVAPLGRVCVTFLGHTGILCRLGGVRCVNPKL